MKVIRKSNSPRYAGKIRLSSIYFMEGRVFRSYLACCLVELVCWICLVSQISILTAVPKELGLQCSVEYIFIMQKNFKSMEEYVARNTFYSC